MIIGLISDTHGLLREEVINNLKGCNLILHSGDIGKLDIIENLNKIAKTEAILGNIDKNIDNKTILNEKIIEVMGKCIYLVHDINKVSIDLKKENIDIVVYGHSHKSNIYDKDNILYINPGSVGPKRFKLPTTMAKLVISDESTYDEYNEDLTNNIVKFKNFMVKFITI
ncbi:metallophosphoesterase family protein [Faecalimicrobium sp. JNUCC 81]